MTPVAIMPMRFHGAPAKTKYANGRGLPASAEAERSILGAIMLDNAAFVDATDRMLKAEHFSLDSHRRIYASIREMLKVGTAVDIITLSNYLRTAQHIEAVGGVAYLASLTDGIPPRANIEHYVKIVKDKAVLRGLINVCNRTIAAALDQTEEADVVAGVHDLELQELRTDMVADGEGIRRIGDFAAGFFENMKAVKEFKQEILGLTYGVGNVDCSTTGLRDGEMTVIGGRPGAGKSSFALGIGIANARDMVPVYYYSAEMKGDGLFSRTLSALSCVNNFLLRDPRQLSDEYVRKLEIAADESRLLPLWIDDRAGLGITQVLARARLWLRKHARAVHPEKAIAIFDFAQLIKADGKDRVERVGNVAEAVAVFAREQNIPTVLLSQLNRPEKKNSSARPTMDDLKESGRLEENADMVGLLFRNPDEKKEGEDEFIIAKQRNGPLGVEKVTFDKTTLMYKQRESDEKW